MGSKTIWVEAPPRSSIAAEVLREEEEEGGGEGPIRLSRKLSVIQA